jgi:hypothetical protein
MQALPQLLENSEHLYYLLQVTGGHEVSQSPFPLFGFYR